MLVAPGTVIDVKPQAFTLTPRTVAGPGGVQVAPVMSTHFTRFDYARPCVKCASNNIR